MTILNNFTSSFGPDAVAAMGIVQKIYMIPMQITLGSSQGVMPLISYNFSSKNYIRMKNSIIFTGKVIVGFNLVILAGYYLGASQLIQIFMNNQVVIDYGIRFLRGFCLGLPFLCLDFLAVGIFQAIGLGKNALIFAVMRKIILEIPAIYILNYLFSLYGLAYAQFCAELVLAIIAIIVLKQIFNKLEK